MVLGTEKPCPSDTVREEELVRAARRVILDALTGDPGPDYEKVQTAKWVIENIWTPVTDED